MSEVAAANPLNDLFRRLRSSTAWVAAQFWATLLLIFAGAAWTRLPDSYAWQVGLTLFVPLVLLAAALLLEAGTMRKLFHDEERRVPLWLGVLTLLVWAAIAWAAWALLDWCSDQIPEWAGYLNSRASAHMRATLFTLCHRLGPIGLAIAVATNYSSAVQLALVAGGHYRCPPGRRVAQPFLHRRAAWNRIASGLVRHAQARGSVFAGGDLLGSSSGMVRSAVEPA